MGLIKAALGAAGGVMADQWKEYFYCEAMDADTLVMSIFTVNRFQKTLWRSRDSGAFPDAAATRREAKTSSRTVPSLRWRTDSV